MSAGEKGQPALCATCAAIHQTEGVIPTYCSRCEPPRLSPSMKRLTTYMMLGGQR